MRESCNLVIVSGMGLMMEWSCEILRVNHTISFFDYFKCPRAFRTPIHYRERWAKLIVVSLQKILSVPSPLCVTIFRLMTKFLQLVASLSSFKESSWRRDVVKHIHFKVWNSLLLQTLKDDVEVCLIIAIASTLQNGPKIIIEATTFRLALLFVNTIGF